MSIAEVPLPAEADPAQIASALLGGRHAVAVRCRQGGNNQVFRIETQAGPFALKLYGGAVAEAASRLAAETAALQFLSDAGCGDAVPRLCAAASDARAALHEWIEGEPLRAIGAVELQRAAAFAERLHDLRNRPSAHTLGNAKEACLSIATVIEQVERRLARLQQVDHAGLTGFLADVFMPAWHAAAARASDWPPLPRDRQTLSPSDFGFHNALRRADGRIVFLDFEYFGWDDPAKLVSDFLWHPGTALDEAAGATFREFALKIYGGDPDFALRLTTALPYYGLRWCLIVLNEFLPEGWRHRQLAGETLPWNDIAERQLAKARALVVRAQHLIEGDGP